MSAECLGWALRVKMKRPATKIALIAVADVANHDTSEVFVSIAYLREVTGLSKPTTLSCIRELEELGILERTAERKGWTNQIPVYLFHMISSVELIEKKGRGRTGKKSDPLENRRETGKDFAQTGELFNGTGQKVDHGTKKNNQVEEPIPTHPTDVHPPHEVELPGLVVPEGPLVVALIEKRWAAIKDRHRNVAGIRKIDDGMVHTIMLRAKQHAQPGQSPRDLWNEFLDTIEGSTFLCGEAPPGVGRDKPFKLTLTWALTAHHFREIIGGKYTDRDGTGGAAGRGLGPTAKATLGAIESLRASRERRGKGRDQGRDYG